MSAISYQENLALLRQNVETLLAKAPIGARTLVLEFDSMLPTSTFARVAAGAKAVSTSARVVARKAAAVSVMVVSEAASVMAAACPTGDGSSL